jgi:hypothetical protein
VWLTKSLAEGTSWSYGNCPRLASGHVNDELRNSPEIGNRLTLVEDLAWWLRVNNILSWEDGLDALWDSTTGRWDTTVRWGPRYGPAGPDGIRGGV